MDDEPELSVVMIAGAQRARAQRTADAVGAQDPGTAIDLIVVDIAPDSDPLHLPPSIRARRIEASAAIGSLFGAGDASRRLLGWELTAEHEEPGPAVARRPPAR
jgi:hypothetical protein